MITLSIFRLILLCIFCGLMGGFVTLLWIWWVLASGRRTVRPLGEVFPHLSHRFPDDHADGQ
jgi:hypothetical protein